MSQNRKSPHPSFRIIPKKELNKSDKLKVFIKEEQIIPKIA